MEFHVHFEEVGKMFGPRAVLYGMVEMEPEAPVAEVVAAAVKLLVVKLQRNPLLMGFEAQSVWSEKGGVVFLPRAQVVAQAA